jgi:hypothetical protein
MKCSLREENMIQQKEEIRSGAEEVGGGGESLKELMINVCVPLPSCPRDERNECGMRPVMFMKRTRKSRDTF